MSKKIICQPDLRDELLMDMRRRVDQEVFYRLMSSEPFHYESQAVNVSWIGDKINIKPITAREFFLPPDKLTDYPELVCLIVAWSLTAFVLAVIKCCVF